VTKFSPFFFPELVVCGSDSPLDLLAFLSYISFFYDFFFHGDGAVTRMLTGF